MIRLLFVVHRYLGIVVGFVLLLWCLSGFVMMYVQYPELSKQEGYQVLQPLMLGSCCTLPEVTVLAQETFSSVIIEMMGESTPVLRTIVAGRTVTLDLLVGAEIQQISAESANSIAESVAAASLINLAPDSLAIVQSDQWTVTGGYNHHRPMYLFASDDEEGTEWYVSGTTGEVVLITTGAERFWNYLGAVVHWLYPAILRQHPVLWAQAVIWLSIAGVFLTLTGLYAGVLQFRNRSSSRASPYSGVSMWHHYTGLVAGVVALLWVGSGLLSMNPWGLLAGESATEERNALQGGSLEWDEVREIVQKLPDLSLPAETVQLELFLTAGVLQALAVASEGRKTRLDADFFLPDPLSESDLERLASVMLPNIQIRETLLLETGDAYYYEHHVAPEFPVYRIITGDEEQRRYYLSATTGQLVAKIDEQTRWYRWLFAGLHRADFLSVLREPPLRDAFMLLMLAAVTLLCATGTYLGIRRLRS